MSDQWGFETRQIHIGGDPDPATGARFTTSTGAAAAKAARHAVVYDGPGNGEIGDDLAAAVRATANASAGVTP